MVSAVLRSSMLQLAAPEEMRGRIKEDESTVPQRDGEWISGELAEIYLHLHQTGLAHSFEVWKGEELAGGVLGLALGGAFADEPPGAVIIFRAPSRDVVESFARTDPYVVGGLVKGWTVRQWTTVVGEGALTPL